MKKLKNVNRTGNGMDTGIFSGIRGKEIFEDDLFEVFLENGNMDDNLKSEETPPEFLNQRIADALRGAQVNRKLHFYTSAQKRLIAYMFISEMANFIIQLKRVNTTLDREITQEALSLSIPLLAMKRNWMEDNPIFDPDWYGYDNNGTGLTDLTGDDLLEKLGTFDPQKIVAKLKRLLDEMIRLFCEIRRKIREADQQKCEDFFDKLCEQYNPKYTAYKYRQWREDWDDISPRTLQYWQHQLIKALLDKGFCRYVRQPTTGEVSQRAIVISADALTHGTTLTEDTAKECAKFEHFAEWKKGIICLNNYRIARYIIKHYANLQESDLQNICQFYMILALVQEDMARLNPQLRLLIEKQQTTASSLVTVCQKTLAPLKPYLRKGVRESVPGEFVAWLLYDSAIREEARNKLCSKSGSKYLCEMALVLSLTGVYGAEADTKTMTAALMPAMGRLPQTTVRRYLQGVKEVRGGSLYACASTKIEELMKKPYNALAGLIK